MSTPHTPPTGYQPPPPPQAKANVNAYGIVAVCLGGVGALFGLIPLTFFLAFLLGVPALVLTGFAWFKSSKVLAGFATAATVLALALGSVGATVMSDVANDLENLGGPSQSDINAGLPSGGLPPPSVPVSPSPASGPPPLGSPGTFTGSCDYSLSMDINEDPVLIGDIDLTNDRDKPVTVEATIRWQQMGYDPITASKTVTVPGGAVKTVRFHETVDIQVLSRVQSWQMNHMGENLCTYDVAEVTGG